jgi:hypothetical protein
MKTWAKVLAALMGASALSGCATYYDDYYRDGYYTSRSYDRYDPYYGGGYYYDAVLWPSYRYYDPWYSPFFYGSYSHRHRHHRRDDWRPHRNDDPYRRGDYHPGSAGQEADRLANRRRLDRPTTGGRGYVDPDRDFRGSGDMQARPARGDWSRGRDGGYESGAPSSQPLPQPEFRAERFEPRAEPRFEQRQEAPRFDPPPPPREEFSRGSDRDDEGEPQ